MSKKRSGTGGSIHRRPNGSWRGQIMDGYTDEGKRNIVNFSGETKADVAQKIRDYQSNMAAAIHLDRTMLFGDWAEKWYANYADQVQPSTYCNYRYTLNILKRLLGEQKLSEILPVHINEAFDALKEQSYSESQLTKCRAMLIQIFDEAESNGLVVRNSARSSKKAKVSKAFSDEPQEEKDAFSEYERGLLMCELPDDLLGNSVRLLLGTGLRVQELLALTKRDIYPDGSEIQISKAVKTVNGKAVLGPPKSKRSYRTVPVPEQFRKYAVFLREHGRDPYIWTHSLQNPLFNVKSFRSRYQTVLSKIQEVRKLSPHCCRHTYVTSLQAAGVPMETIARLVGHSSIDTTDQYLHTSTKTLEQAVSCLNSGIA